MTQANAEALFERWCTPGPPATRPGDTALGDQATRGLLTVSGVQEGVVDQVRTYRWDPAAPADGRPSVVLVHGWGSRASHFAAMIRGLTAAGIRCAAFDAPGHGESGGTTASLPRMAAAFRLLCRALAYEGTPPAAAVGYSFGGLAAGLACVPDVLAGPPAEIPALALVSSPVTLASATRRWLEMAGEPQSRQADLMAELRRRGFDGDRFDLLAVAERLPRRLLLVHDQGDDEVPVSDAEALAAARPDAMLELTDRYGHARMLLARPVVQAVTAFVQPRHEDMSVS
ncbi:alpha/beta fold hydrolase [Thalassobaculum sp. OXR-137]|uniref:alpha/beta hydrolase n=1 Tax=Thalassobaculum sp. OXR-137 TaxID=3100173 RepID=UPI002AC8B36F|nr:alpha/beta fold hydrolase [Thalassobaculum sp. OXR-137]WPZ33946.1 alpha/beta fold hydrolase [Thalassobaculum sp. OXR-137]